MNIGKYIATIRPPMIIPKIDIIIGSISELIESTALYYTKKAAFSEVKWAAGPYKTGVEVCSLTNPLSVCDTGANGVPASSGSQAVASVAVTDGAITVTPKNFKGLNGENTYTLTPTGGGNGAKIVRWTETCGAPDLC